MNYFLKMQRDMHQLQIDEMCVSLILSVPLSFGDLKCVLFNTDGTDNFEKIGVPAALPSDLSSPMRHWFLTHGGPTGEAVSKELQLAGVVVQVRIYIWRSDALRALSPYYAMCWGSIESCDAALFMYEYHNHHTHIGFALYFILYCTMQEEEALLAAIIAERQALLERGEFILSLKVVHGRSFPRGPASTPGPSSQPANVRTVVPLSSLSPDNSDIGSSGIVDRQHRQQELQRQQRQLSGPASNGIADRGETNLDQSPLGITQQGNLQKDLPPDRNNGIKENGTSSTNNNSGKNSSSKGSTERGSPSPASLREPLQQLRDTSSNGNGNINGNDNINGSASSTYNANMYATPEYTPAASAEATPARTEMPAQKVQGQKVREPQQTKLSSNATGYATSTSEELHSADGHSRLTHQKQGKETEATRAREALEAETRDAEATRAREVEEAKARELETARARDAEATRTREDQAARDALEAGAREVEAARARDAEATRARELEAARAREDQIAQSYWPREVDEHNWVGKHHRDHGDEDHVEDHVESHTETHIEDHTADSYSHTSGSPQVIHPGLEYPMGDIVEEEDVRLQAALAIIDNHSRHGREEESQYEDDFDV